MIDSNEVFPLCSAPSIDGVDGKMNADCLSDSEFPRAPVAAATRRIERGTGVFFWFGFLSRERK